MIVLEIILKALNCIPYILKFDWGSIPGIFRGYIFKDYNKHVTMYKTGNAIIIHTFTIKVFNPSRVKEILREINIEDGKVTAKFPKLSEMKRTKLKDRFSKFGFWIKSENNIVERVEEYYWGFDHPEIEDQIAKNDPQELKYRIHLQEGQLKRNKTYKITYIISVPGMYPLENGYYYSDLHSPKFSNYIFTSSMRVEHSIKRMKYTVSFEEGIKVSASPKCNVCERSSNFITKSKPIRCEFQDNIIYKKYTFIINRPKYQNLIEVKWDVEKGKRKKAR